MADFVLDASALAKLIFAEPESGRFTAWYQTQVTKGATFCAPTLLGYEMAQLVAKNFRHLGPKEFGQRVEQPLVGIELEPCHAAVGPYVSALTAYDASYVALAVSRGAPLVTYDKALAGVARQHGVRVETP
ncbi:MAG: type II toxin-antitoxin system VapC family toxin [Thermoplasmatota archaeon]